MVQIIEATFKDGVFKPDEQPALSDSTRVRLVVEPMGEAADRLARQAAWASLEQIWRNSALASQGDRMTREQLHERR